MTITGNGATPCEIGDGTATGTIIDDDVAPQDNEPPGVTVTPVTSSPTSAAEIDFTIEFTEDVTGFNAGDVHLRRRRQSHQRPVRNRRRQHVHSQGDRNVGHRHGDRCRSRPRLPMTWRRTTTPRRTRPPSSGTSRSFRTAGTSVTVTPDVASPTSNSPIPFTVQFTEDVTGFDAADVVLTAPARVDLNGRRRSTATRTRCP